MKYLQNRQYSFGQTNGVSECGEHPAYILHQCLRLSSFLSQERVEQYRGYFLDVLLLLADVLENFLLLPPDLSQSGYVFNCFLHGRCCCRNPKGDGRRSG